MERCRFYWEHTSAGGVRLLRAFGTTPEVVIPERIAGLPVTEIGAYCFAASERMSRSAALWEKCEVTEISVVRSEGGSPDELRRTGEEESLSSGKTPPENREAAEASVVHSEDGSPDELRRTGEEESPSSGKTPPAVRAGQPEEKEEGGPALRELCGSYIERLILPDSVQKAGNLMCYQCTLLREITCGAGLSGIGSDAFMNCGKLREIRVRCGSGEPSGLRQMLAQRSAEITAVFLGTDGAGCEAKILFTEYYESYDEIAPAHLFGRKIEGEGFRARQCFAEGIFDFGQYDRIFPRACDGETEPTLCRLAMNRLLYPAGLSPEAKRMYQTYAGEHARCICAMAVKERETGPVRYLCENGLADASTLDEALAGASRLGWAEGTAQLLMLKRACFAGRAGRYEFEDF